MKKAYNELDDPDIINIVAISSLKTGEFKEALELFNKILENHPGHIATLIHLSQVYQGLSDDEMAENSLKQVLSVYEDHEDGSFYLAKIYARTNRKEQAKELLEKTLETNDSDKLKELLKTL